jgi:hypothetical protein
MGTASTTSTSRNRAVRQWCPQCAAPGTVDAGGIIMCEDHAGERGYGPKASTASLTDYDRRVIAEAREICAVKFSGLCDWTGDEDRTLAAYVAFGRAQLAIGTLLALIERRDVS